MTTPSAEHEQRTLLELDGCSLTIADALDVSRRDRTVLLSPAAAGAVRASRELKRTLISQEIPIYGVTTGTRRQRAPADLPRQDGRAAAEPAAVHGLRDRTDRAVRGRAGHDVAAGQLLGQGELRRPRRARRAAARTAQPRCRPADPRARLLRRQRRPGPAGLRRADDRRRVDRHLRRGDAPGRRRARRAGPGAAGARGQGGAGAAQRHLVHERVRVHRGGSGPRAGRPGRPADGDGHPRRCSETAATSTRSCSTTPSRIRGWCRARATSAACWPTRSWRSTARSCSPAAWAATDFLQLDRQVQDKYSIRCAPHVTGVLRDVLDWVEQWVDDRDQLVRRQPAVQRRRPAAWRAAATSTAGTSGRRWTR